MTSWAGTINYNRHINNRGIAPSWSAPSQSLVPMTNDANETPIISTNYYTPWPNDNRPSSNVIIIVYKQSNRRDMPSPRPKTDRIVGCPGEGSCRGSGGGGVGVLLHRTLLITVWQWGHSTVWSSPTGSRVRYQSQAYYQFSDRCCSRFFGSWNG